MELAHTQHSPVYRADDLAAHLGELGGGYSYHSKSIRLQFDRAMTIPRPTL